MLTLLPERRQGGTLAQLVVPIVILLAGISALVLSPAQAYGAPGWLSSFEFPTTDGGSSVPQVAVSADGDAVVVWRQFDGEHAVIQAVVRPAGGVFSSPVDLSASGQDASEPQVAMGADGDAVVVWRQFDGEHAVIQAVVRPAGGVFSSPVDLSASGQDASEPQVAMGADEDGVVVWERASGESVVVQAVVRPAGGTFSVPADLSAPAERASRSRVAMAADGEALVVWEHEAVPHQGLVVQGASRPAGGVFSAAFTISPPGIASWPDVAMNRAGDAVVVWRWIAGMKVQATVRPEGGSFSAPVDLSATGHAAAPQVVAIDDAGRWVAAWEQIDESFGIATDAAAGHLDGSASGAVRLSGDYGWAPEIAMSPGGDAIAVWGDLLGAVTSASVRPMGGQFSSLTNISAFDRGAVSPDIAMDDSGSGLAVWAGMGVGGVEAAIYDASSPVLQSVSVPETGTTEISIDMSVTVFDAWSSVSVTFDFGDGTTDTGSAVSHTYQSGGNYQVTITATDVLGNSTSTSREIAITDTSPPETSIVSGPAGVTTDSAPSFGFSSSEAGSSFQCRVDDGAFAGCSSPHTTSTLGAGAHTFYVRATDQAGNTDPTPATHSFTVQVPSPPSDGSDTQPPVSDETPAPKPTVTAACKRAKTSRAKAQKRVKSAQRRLKAAKGKAKKRKWGRAVRKRKVALRKAKKKAKRACA